MTPREADRLIKAGKPVKLYDKRYRECVVVTIVCRDRWNIYTASASGGKYDRGEMEVVLPSEGET